jgi:hypothetical protein
MSLPLRENAPGISSSWMTGTRPTTAPGIAAPRDHRTGPSPADTRRACCHVLSSFQRTRTASSVPSGLSAFKRRTFQTYRTFTHRVKAFFDVLAFSRLGTRPAAHHPSRHRLRWLKAPEPGRSPTLLLRQLLTSGRARRSLEREGRDARRSCLRARHLAASLTNIRPRDGPVNRKCEGPGPLPEASHIPFGDNRLQGRAYDTFFSAETSICLPPSLSVTSPVASTGTPNRLASRSLAFLFSV